MVLRKTNKSGVIFGIRTNHPDKNAKYLAKMFSSFLGAIRKSYIENSSDLLNQINYINMESKSPASQGIKIIIHQYSC